MLRHRLSRFVKSERGASAVELAFALFLLTIPILNVVDLAFYAFTWMQTQNAAQMGAQAAFSNCNVSYSLPASTQCYGAGSANNITFYDAVAQGIEESALNNTVTLTGSTVSDGYYCTSTTGSLALIGTAGAAYADAGTDYGEQPNASDTAPSSGGNTTCPTGSVDTNATPGEYVQVNVTHTYSSIFPGMTVVSLLPAIMTATAWARLD
jgi:Flp pilus assembly protein TadG